MSKINLMISVELSERVWDELSEALWDRLPIPVCEACHGMSGVDKDSPDCGVCLGSGMATMWHPSLDNDPLAIAARVIDSRIHNNRSSVAPQARETLRGIL